MAKKPGQPTRGSASGRPIMVLLDLLSQRWALRILWELKTERLTFRELQGRCDEVSPTLLNKRLKELRSVHIIDNERPGYGLTQSGRELGRHLSKLNDWSDKWADELKGST